ncbi:MAG: PKD domain-containing protein [Bacteroidetes bacterium]|nr:PKD domain-containing protein [Bacteroidota bacterium]
MKKFMYALLAGFLSMSGSFAFAQNADQPQTPTLITQSETMIEVPSIAEQIANGSFIPAEEKVKEFNPKHWGVNAFIPGKGLPKGNDPLWEKHTQVSQRSGRTPILTFVAATAEATPTDPTGAVGPNHFVNSWNSSFRIWDKSGNPLTSPASLGTIFPGADGDPIVLYDPFADRFLISEFYHNGFDVAISKGPNPVTSGWYVYRFPTNTFPDYPKFSVWSDGYYITANKDKTSAGTSQVVFVLDRAKMIAGENTAQMIGFPLPGISVSGFYSPLAFNANVPTPPPPGNASIVYLQDDSWSGVTFDHLKIWKVNVNWTTPASSTISSPQIIITAPFDAVFDGGSFYNLPQPSGNDIDALQATIMYMAQCQRFSSYNSAVFNFVVDLDGNDNKAGIRWYELRQNTDGAPWYIYQEGTYSQPQGHSAFCGNMCMDIDGNIALAYTVVSKTQFPSLRFTGRYASDPLNIMTVAEDVIAAGTQIDLSNRYGDYAQMTIDPVDGKTFWSIGEYFSEGRKNGVGVFQLAPSALTAQFSGVPTTVCTGSSVAFTDQSLHSPTSWTWSFPCGTPSTYSGQNPPPVVYNTVGTYDVTLTVSDGLSIDTKTKTGYITVKDIIADFSAAPATLYEGNAVTFSDYSLCYPASWSWSFPGGTPSSFIGQTPPAITYNTAGNYNVSLTVSNSLGSDTKVRTGYITVLPAIFNMSNGTITICGGDFYDSGGPSANYQDNESFTETFYPNTAESMVRFVFSSFSTQSGRDYLKIYNGVNVSAPLIGIYTGTTGPGTVTASNSSGALTFVFTSDESINEPGWAASISCYSAVSPPVADFSAAPVNALVAHTVSFSDFSANFPTSWAWSITPGTFAYVGGTSATSQNPQVKFSALGFYTVTLIAANAYGSDTLEKTNYINVANCNYNSLPYFEGFDATTIPACWSQIDRQGNDQIWKFGVITGQSPNPALTGNYAYLNSNEYGYGNSQNADLISPPLNLSLYTGITLQFSHYFKSYSGSSGTLSYSVNNGSAWTQIAQFTTTSVSNPATFAQTIAALAGQLQVKFKWNYFGDNTSYWGVDDIQVTGTCISSPVAGVSVEASQNPVCVDAAVTFTATPVNGGSSPSFQWKLNGSNVTGASEIGYSYIPVHSDTVSCVLTSNALCVSGNPATSNPIVMTVNPLLPVSISITASANPVDPGIPVTFTATPVNGGITPMYVWKVNGNVEGPDSLSFVYVPEDGDVISCVLFSSESCASSSPATSNEITISVSAISANIAIADTTVSGTACFNASQTIRVAGNGKSFVVPDGGSAEMIAGQNILYFPGTLIDAGGYMIGSIAPLGPWCYRQPFMAVATGTEETLSISGDQFFMIYPNPSSGNFTIEMHLLAKNDSFFVEIFNINGERIFSDELVGLTKHELSLKGKPSGIYLIRIISANYSGTMRIVKQ